MYKKQDGSGGYDFKGGFDTIVEYEMLLLVYKALYLFRVRQVM